MRKRSNGSPTERQTETHPTRAPPAPDRGASAKRPAAVRGRRSAWHANDRPRTRQRLTTVLALRWGASPIGRLRLTARNQWAPISRHLRNLFAAPGTVSASRPGVGHGEVAFCHGASSQFQDSGREHGQRVELASSAKFLEAAVDQNVTSRSLPDLDDCVLAHALHSQTSRRRASSQIRAQSVGPDA